MDAELTTNLRTKIWNWNSCKNKSCNDIIWGTPALAVCWNEPSVTIKFNVKFKNIWISQYFNCSIIPSIFLGYKITETNALSMAKWNWKEHQQCKTLYDRMLSPNTQYTYHIGQRSQEIRLINKKFHYCYLNTQKTVHKYWLWLHC